MHVMQIVVIDMKLTKNQSLVLESLGEAQEPLSAYSLLDRLRDQGLRAPLQVYRALEKLIDKGLVHRLESLNAFVVCSHEGCAESTAAVFAICENCGKVNEFSDQQLSRQISVRARQDGFNLKKTTIELRGECSDCAAAA